LIRALFRPICLAVVLSAATPGYAVKLDPQDAALLAARDAFEANHRTKLATLAPKLKYHLLEPYVEYWQLFFRLPGASAEDVRDFLSRYPGTALAEQLRVDWLKVLGRSGRWELFQAEYPALSGDDPEVTCYMLLARWKREDASVLGDFKTFWSAPRELPEGCLTLASTRSGSAPSSALRSNFSGIRRSISPRRPTGNWSSPRSRWPPTVTRASPRDSGAAA